MGALTSHAELAAEATVRRRLTALADACAIVGSHATRAHGTLGGNLHERFAGDGDRQVRCCASAPSVRLRSASGTRTLSIDELLAGPGETTAAPGELLEAVEMPLPPEGAGSCYLRLEYRRQMEIAVVGATAVVAFEGGRVVDARVAITALAPTIRRVAAAEAALVGTDAGREAAQAAAEAIARRVRADLRRARFRRVPERDGGCDRAARDRGRRRTRRGSSHSCPGKPRTSRGSGVRVASTLRVNGISCPVEIEPHASLLETVREQIGLTGAKEGCDDSECGACMMLLDGEPVNSCSYLALQAEGRQITTVEGLAPPGELQCAPALVPRARGGAVRVLHAWNAGLGNRSPSP